MSSQMPEGLGLTPQITQPLAGNMALNKLQGLNKSFSMAGEKPSDQKVMKAARDFEAVFFQQMLNAMDKTVDRENSLFSGGQGEETFRGMLYEEVSKSVCNRPGGSGLGMADVIFRQMQEAMRAQDEKAQQSIEALTKGQ